MTHFKLACRDCPGKCEEDQGRMSRSQARLLVVTKFVRNLAPVPSTQQGSSLILAAWLTAFTWRYESSVTLCEGRRGCICVFVSVFLMGTLLLLVAGYSLVGCRTTRMTGRYIMQLQSRTFTNQNTNTDELGIYDNCRWFCFVNYMRIWIYMCHSSNLQYHWQSADCKFLCPSLQIRWCWWCWSWCYCVQDGTKLFVEVINLNPFCSHLSQPFSQCNATTLVYVSLILESNCTQLEIYN